MKKEPLSLPEAVGKSFRLAPGAAIVSYSRKFGHVDLSKIDVAKAKELVKDGYPGLVATGKSDTPATT